jgi:hypothetical protein
MNDYTVTVLTYPQVIECFDLAHTYSTAGTRSYNGDPKNKSGIVSIQLTFQNDLAKMAADMLLGVTHAFMRCNTARSVLAGTVDHYDYRFRLADQSLMVMNVKSKCKTQSKYLKLTVSADREVEITEDKANGGALTCKRAILKNAPGVQERVYALFMLSHSSDELKRITEILNSRYEVYASVTNDAEWAQKRTDLARELEETNRISVQFIGWISSKDLFEKHQDKLEVDIDFFTKEPKLTKDENGDLKQTYSFQIAPHLLNDSIVALKSFLNDCAQPDLSYVNAALAVNVYAAPPTNYRSRSTPANHRFRPYK